MINIYLFNSDENKEKIEALTVDDMSITFRNIDNTSLFIASFSLKMNGQDEAKKLSDINEAVMKLIPPPQTLVCESSEYFNKVLYPLINRIERKLRELLYLAASLSNNEKASSSITTLEELDFGTIFNLLFIDSEFISKVKQRVNAEKSSKFHGLDKYTKSEISEYIEELEENSLWKILIGDSDVPSLQKSFRKVKDYRNDVMHAHNIDKITFGKAYYLFKKINEELDEAIEKRTGQISHSHLSDFVVPDFNETILTAIKSFELLQNKQESEFAAFSHAFSNHSTELNDKLAQLSQVDWNAITKASIDLKQMIENHEI